jgi:hypothetical protein
MSSVVNPSVVLCLCDFMVTWALFSSSRAYTRANIRTHRVALLLQLHRCSDTVHMVSRFGDIWHQ